MRDRKLLIQMLSRNQMVGFVVIKSEVKLYTTEIFESQGPI